jgi:hypothetical protein
VSLYRNEHKKYFTVLREKMPDSVEFQPVSVDLPSKEFYDKFNKFKGAVYWELLALLTKDCHKFNLTNVDIRILLHLFLLGRTKLLIVTTRGKLSEDLNISYTTTCQAIAKLVELQLIRWSRYKEVDGIIVSPDLINLGTARRRAFKRMLWERKIVQPEKVEKPRCYPLTRKKRKAE